MSKRLIITGDDFGLAVPVNEAVEEAYRSGVLTATSLLVGGMAARDAVVRATRNPGLRVGLHVALGEGRSILRPHDIPGLVNPEGEFPPPGAAMLRLLLASPSVKRQIEAELHAQFHAFRATGLPLDHVNGHCNIHAHPVVFPILSRVARAHGATAMRLPYEPFRPSFRAARRKLWARALLAPLMGAWGASFKRRLRKHGFDSNDCLFGLHDVGSMNADLLVRFIGNLPEGVTEIHCHPSSRRCAEIDRTMALYDHEGEFAALTSALVKDAIRASGALPMAGFRDL